MPYTVKQLAKLSEISACTFHQQKFDSLHKAFVSAIQQNLKPTPLISYLSCAINEDLCIARIILTTNE